MVVRVLGPGSQCDILPSSDTVDSGHVSDRRLQSYLCVTQRGATEAAAVVCFPCFAVGAEPADFALSLVGPADWRAGSEGADPVSDPPHAESPVLATESIGPRRALLTSAAVRQTAFKTGQLHISELAKY